MKYDYEPLVRFSRIGDCELLLFTPASVVMRDNISPFRVLRPALNRILKGRVFRYYRGGAHSKLELVKRGLESCSDKYFYIKNYRAVEVLPYCINMRDLIDTINQLGFRPLIVRRGVDGIPPESKIPRLVPSVYIFRDKLVFAVRYSMRKGAYIPYIVKRVKPDDIKTVDVRPEFVNTVFAMDKLSVLLEKGHRTVDRRMYQKVVSIIPQTRRGLFLQEVPYKPEPISEFLERVATFLGIFMTMNGLLNYGSKIAIYITKTLEKV